MRLRKQVYPLLLFLLIFEISFSQNGKSVINSCGHYSLKYLLKNFREIEHGNEIQWLYRDGDSAKFALKNYDDHSWKCVSPTLAKAKDTTIKFNGIGWFRLHVLVDTIVPSGLSISLNHQGASNIILNGKLIKTFGLVSPDPKIEKGFIPNLEAIVLPHYELGSWMNLTIRYSNADPNHAINSAGEIEPGFNLIFVNTQLLLDQTEAFIYSSTLIGVSIFMFFLTLTFIHFLLYMFYKSNKANLYYALLSAIIAYIGLMIVLFFTTTDPNNYQLYLLILLVAFPWFFHLLIVVLNSLFKLKRNWITITLFVLTCISSVDVFFNKIIFIVSLAILIFSTLVYILVILFKALRNKVKGAKILSVGFGFFALFYIGIMLWPFFVHGTISIESDWLGVIIRYSFLVALLGIPISMSIFLAWDFANTNKSLEQKLNEVEVLSQKSLEQEKEKQKILAEQNTMLESQVAERTREIVEQKKLIEEKNKDITDSINYAQRIQRSILPSDEEIKNLFGDSFVLFKPRDIVSGDFYQFKNLKNRKYAIMADCTGHGVPGALMSMIGSNLLHQIIVERGIEMPNQILTELHKEVKFALRQNAENDSRDGMDISIVMFRDDKIYTASANRPIILIDNNELMEIKPDKQSIGGSQSVDELVFSLNEHKVEKGYMLYMFSDGYADQFGGPKGKKFKVKNLIGNLVNVSNEKCETQNKILSDTFEDWKNDLEQIDDVCLIGIRC